MRPFPFFPSLVAVLLIASVAAAAPATAVPVAASDDAATAAAEYAPDDVAAFDGQVLAALREEGLAPELLEEVAAALADAAAVSNTDVRPFPICDFACGVTCPVRWQHIQIVVHTVREWQRRRLCQGWTDCGSLYECLYRVLIVHQVWLHVCNCDPDPTNPWDDYGCYWFSGASFIRQCTEPACRRIRPAAAADPVATPQALR